jgi:hypothetical protein
MGSFDALFPDPMDCYFALFQDAVYEHDRALRYIFESGVFIRRDRIKVVNKIKDISNLVYASFAWNDPSFTKCHPLIDYSALLAVLTRYSRDIYGFRRITAKIHDLSGKIDETQQKHLEQIVIDGADFGFKIPSEAPYIERQAAVLLYWFSVLKPFHLEYMGKNLVSYRRKKGRPGRYLSMRSMKHSSIPSCFFSFFDFVVNFLHSLIALLKGRTAA